ncbi:hydantoinase/oxoprolinase family protein [Nonomuraea ferruginea]|uniref:Hydantoinase/oxoprolinase family protein n=1 Tax=Nonomuraea ferruginea TaxID=46174 RepID=A0ABT4T4D5_9ACTN|nr:hydantoinase/oxoprolinase family protein [Nonomuraea ferruginea]MDA0644119.1 hydantoinase/oxoprolinase family protein [Nonomuraea ferruginea]
MNQTEASGVKAFIGVDTGGTFTDTVVTLSDGRLGVGKALSTPGRVEQGVLDSIVQAAAALGLTLSELLSRTVILTHGTTVGLNALLTGGGARVGLLTTAGFESTLPIAKANKLHGLDELDVTMPVRWRKPDQLVARSRIAGVSERVDVSGAVVRPLDEEQARAAIRRLAERGADSVAVCLLWSPVNDGHERRLAALVAEELPGVHVSCSSAIAPVVGEYERTSTAVLDAYVAPVVATYLRALQERLREHGFGGVLMILRTGGGAEPVEHTLRAPVNTLRSGPVAGLAATAALAAELGHANVVATDVGGTSFDVGLVIGGAMQRASTPMVHRHALAIPVVEVESIGTGGGSLAWLDQGLGALRVGPRSAGADPGPACYGRGGTRPTLTDASAVLGYLSRLGESMPLDVAAAREAIRAHIAEPLGIGVVAAAEGIVRIAADQMRDLIRRTTIQRGHDPSAFALVAFGGAGPQYASWYADGLGATDVIIPNLAAELSAYGAVSSDLSIGVERGLVPGPVAEAGPAVAAALAELAGGIEADLPGAVDSVTAVSGRAPVLRHTVALRFYRQQRRIELPVAVPVDAAELARLESEFRKRYEEIVGAGTAADGTPVEAVGVRVELVAPVPVPPPATRPGGAAEPVDERAAWFAGAEHRCAVYDWRRLSAGCEITGPAFVESGQTTVVLPPGRRARMDAGGHLHLT